MGRVLCTTLSITSGHLIAMPSSSSSPSTSSQQLVWSCSPFFTNSMISQLQVPAVNNIVSTILMLTLVLPKITIISLQYLHHRVHMFWRRAPVSLPCPPCWSARPRGSWTPSRFSTTCAFYQTLLCLKLIFLTWELRTLCIFLYHSECCLVFAGYGAIVFMWQISLKTAESGRTIFVKIDHYLRGRAVKPFSFSFSIFLKKNSGSAAEEIVFNLFFVNNFDIRMHGGNYPLLFPSCRSTRF